MCCPIGIIKLLTFFGIFGHHLLFGAQETSTVAVPCGRTPNFTFCSTRPPNRRQGCMMGLRSGEGSAKAYCEGRAARWEHLSPPSSGLTLATFRLPLDAELLAQPPPSQIAAELYSSFNIDSLCDALRGQRVGHELCHYDPNNTVPTTPGAVRFERKRIQSDTAAAASATSYTASKSATLRKCTRKEYRMLTADERTRFHNALLQLKHGQGTYEYDRISFLHSIIRKMPGAHGGPTFVCWHREYMKRMEIALRSVDPTVCLPYWDSTLDWRLDNPADSMLFSDLLMGSPDSSNNNYVTNSFLTNWITLRGDPVQRNLGAEGELFPLNALHYIINTNQSYNIFAFPEDADNATCNVQPADNVLETNHNNVHAWLGGHMLLLETAAMDPIFFLFHSFIDYIWEQWRLRWQTREQRETQFPPYAQIDQCEGGNEYYQLNATMIPFLDPEIPNWVCLSNNYTDFLYTYSLSPTCNKAGNCASDFLFCDTTNQKYPFAPTCSAKIKPGGNCTKFFGNREQPCFNSTCDQSSGKCAQSQQQSQQKYGVVIGGGKGNGKAHGATTPSQTVPSPSRIRLCYDNHECCPQWASNGTCGRAKIIMNNWCPASCNFDGCQPYPKANLKVCSDIHTQCLRWSLVKQHAGHGFGHRGHNKRQKPSSPIPMTECDRNPHFMARNCAKTCKKCGAARRERCAQITPVN